MDAPLTVCPKHGLSDAMPASGRCRTCIEESNAEARPYLETAHVLAEGCRSMNKYLRESRERDKAIG